MRVESIPKAAVTLAWRPAGAAIAVGRRSERELRRRLGAGLGQATLAMVDGALASPYADDVVQRVLDSGVAERAVAGAMSGELVDVVARDLVRFHVLERVTDRLLADSAVDRALDRIGPQLERIVEQALASPGVERVMAEIVESRLVHEAIGRMADEAVNQLRESQAMWTLVDEVAQSPAVSEAITQQGAGFADQVGEEVRERSRTADAKLERAAWRVLRRRRLPGGEAPSTSGAT